MTAPRSTSATPRAEQGSITPFVLGLTLIAMLLIAGTVAVTSAHLSRMRMLDAADGAALSAANALDDTAYSQGLGASVPLSDTSVQGRAAAYLASRPRPGSILGWRLAPGTGTPDGRTAVVALVGEAELPMVGPALRELGVTVTISVRSQARADLVVP
jgi:Putative Flp pilus-assembly TadE/G-like